MWEVVLRPGDPGTEAGVYLIWFGFVERVPASMAYDDPGIGTIRGRLLDADGNDPEEPFPTGLPCITPNLAVPNGFVVLHNDTRHPYVAATALADPLTGEYAFYDIPPDVYMIYACDVPIDYVWSQKQVRMSPGIDAVHDILVPRFYARMQGHVLDVHGVPVADTRVVFRLGPGNVWKDTRTDADGHYIFESLEEVETMGFLEAEAGGNMRAMAVDADADEPDFCRAATGKRGNHYVMFYSGVNYQVDFYLETLPALTGDVRGFVFHDSLQPPAWQGDGLWQEESEPTLGAVVVNLRDAYTDEVVATTTTGVFDEAAVLAQGWIKPLSTIPPDEFGGIFDGDIPGFYEFRDVAPGIYTVEVVALPGYAKTAVHSGVLVQAGIAAELDLGLATLVPSAGLIEGGVFDDLWIDTNPLSAFFEEKAVVTGAPVSVTDHLGYVLDSFVQPSPLCYPSSPSGLCDRSDLGEEIAIERRVAPGPRIYIGNDPSHPEYNANYMPMALNYDLGQGTAKYEADWSLIPAAFGGLGGPLLPGRRLLPDDRPLIAAPVLQTTVVAVGGALTISGENFGATQGYATVSLAGQALPVTAWSDTSIEVEIPAQAVSGPLLVANSSGPSNAISVEVDYGGDAAAAADLAARSVYVDASGAAGTWPSIGEALQHLPTATPRYVFVAPGTYKETIHITESDLRIIGSGPLDTIIDGSVVQVEPSQQGIVGDGPVFFIGEEVVGTPVENIVISGFTITRGSVDGDIGAGIFGGYYHRGIDINNNVIVRNGGCYGGGIWFHRSVHDVDIWSNVIAENGNFCGYGGAISVNDEPETEKDSEVDREIKRKKKDKEASQPGVYRIFNNLIYRNHSVDYGGAIALYHLNDSIEIYGNMLIENASDDHGGAAYFGHTGPMRIYANVFLRNYCADDGGAISFEDTYDDKQPDKKLDIFNNLFVQNIADDKGENHARGGALAFDDAFMGRVFNNTIVGNIVAGSYAPAGGGIDGERSSEDFDGSEGIYVAPGFSDPKIYNNIIWENWRLNYDQKLHGDEEDLAYGWGTNYRWSVDEIHVDNPAVQGLWETHKHSDSFSFVRHNIIRGGYPDQGNLDVAPGFVDPAGFDWHLRADSPAIDLGAEVADAATDKVAPPDDLDRLPRVASDGKVDAGAFEYHPDRPYSLRIPTSIIGAINVPVPGTVELGCDGGCDDDNFCTTDVCNAPVGCMHLANSDPCDDGSICTINDRCNAGTCVGGAALNCDDGNVCTDDRCDAALGCQHLYNAASCDDGDLCTAMGSCVGGACVAGPDLDCDDANACTDDSCDPATGCSVVANQAFCDDADACTVGDRCSLGVCLGNLDDCNDGNPCTDDDCQPLLGCTHIASVASCNDADPCTDGDVCTDGVCSGLPTDCSALDNSCQRGVCDAELGGCVAEATVDCSALDGAGVVGQCNPVNGRCEARSCASVVLSPHTGLQSAGGTLVFDVAIDSDGSGLESYQLRLLWDPAVLDFERASGGDSPAFVANPSCNVDPAAGTAVCSANSAGSAASPSSSIHVATVSFFVVANAERALVTVRPAELVSYAGVGLIPCESSNALDVRCLAGDVSGDGRISIRDALTIAEYTVGLLKCDSVTRFGVCDVNASNPDGSCNIFDALRIGYCSVGLGSCDFERGPLVCEPEPTPAPPSDR